MKDRRLKEFTKVHIKDAEQGLVTAVFATLNVIDSDGDVTVPGAFTEGEAVRISAYGHKSWEGKLPVGRGTIKEIGDEAIFEGKFFLNTEAGREHFELVKEMSVDPGLQEWSYGFDILDGAPGQFDGQDVFIIRKLKVHEVSPVLLGAGVNTRTLALKGKKAFATIEGSYEALTEAIYSAVTEDLVSDDEDGWVSIQATFEDSVVVTHRTSDEEPVHYRYDYTVTDDGEVTLANRSEVELTVEVAEKARKFVDQSARLMFGIKAFTDRAGALAALRAKEGRDLSKATSDRLALAADALEEAAAKTRSLVVADAPAGESYPGLDLEAMFTTLRR